MLQLRLTQHQHAVSPRTETELNKLELHRGHTLLSKSLGHQQWVYTSLGRSCAVASLLLPGLRGPPWPIDSHRPTDGWCATRYGRPSVAYVTPSRRATRTALSNSSSARACHLDVATLRRFSHLPYRRWALLLTNV
jgi:hypothetical protein